MGLIIILLLRTSLYLESVATSDCLLHEMLFIKELKPSLNVQSDLITAKVF